MKGLTLILILFASQCVETVLASDETEWFFQGVNFDNDWFVSANSDGRYSAGLEMIWARASLSKSTAEVVRAGVGLQIHTPNEIEVKHEQQHDQPWAGYVFGRIGSYSQTHQRRDQLNIEIGLVGPVSGADQVQHSVHQMMGSKQPEGWNHQLDNELTLNVGYQRSRAIWRGKSFVGSLDTRAYFFLGGEIGTLRTNAFGGLTLKMGKPVVSYTDLGGLPGQIRDQGGDEHYVFFSIEGKWVAHDLFIDGSLFRDNSYVASRNAQYVATVGWFKAISQAWSIGLSVVQSSVQVDRSGQSPHRYGSVEFVRFF